MLVKNLSLFFVTFVKRCIVIETNKIKDMKFFTFFTTLVLLTACNSSDNNTKESKEKTPLAPLAEASEYDSLMAMIDRNLPDLSRVESLIYYKEDGSSMAVTAHLDQNSLITKIEEDQLDGKTGIRTKSYFYSNGGVQFASRRTTIKGEGMDAYFSEEVSFYTPEGKVKESKERISDDENYIENEEFRKIKPVQHSNENAYKVLKQQGQYVTTFQGFVENGPYHFLVVGEDVPADGYYSSISIQEDSPTLRYLRAEGKKALGKELDVQFERYTDEMGYIVQILRDLALVERK